MVDPSHFDHAAVAVAGAFLAITVIGTIVQWRREAHETALKWSASAFVSLLTFVLAFYDDRHASPNSTFNLIGAAIAGLLAAVIYIGHWVHKWPDDSARSKLYVAAKRCLYSAVLALGANFFVYTSYSQQHSLAATIGDGALAIALGATAINAAFTVVFWLGSRGDDGTTTEG